MNESDLFFFFFFLSPRDAFFLSMWSSFFSLPLWRTQLLFPCSDRNPRAWLKHRSVMHLSDFVISSRSFTHREIEPLS